MVSFLFFSFFKQGVYGASNDIIEEKKEGHDNCFEREKEGIILHIIATAPAITINDIELKCFEKERTEAYGFEYDAPASIPTRIRNTNDNVELFKTSADAVTTTLIGEEIELFRAR